MLNRAIRSQTLWGAVGGVTLGVALSGSICLFIEIYHLLSEDGGDHNLLELFIGLALACGSIGGFTGSILGAIDDKKRLDAEQVPPINAAATTVELSTWQRAPAAPTSKTALLNKFGANASAAKNYSSLESADETSESHASLGINRQ